MNWWNILEISHDSDLKTIKKAYAKLLKIYNPEDDAAGYQRLREAYDAAVKYAKKNNDRKTQELINDNLDKSIIDEVQINNNEVDKSESYSIEDKLNKSKVDSYGDYINNEGNKNENEVNENKQNKSSLDSYVNYEADKTKNETNENAQIKQFLDRLNEIYNDIYLRTDSEVWDELLNSDVIWNVHAFSIIEDKMFNFLIKNKYLPAEIWTKLNNNFNWSKSEIKLYDKYSAPIVDEFLKNIKEPNKLKYDYIRSIDPEIADKYLYERQQAYEAMKDKKYAKAYRHLKNANSLFGQDSELLRLMGDYNYELKDLEKALEYYKSAFEINNYDLDSALHLGIILVSYERFSEAISCLKIYLSYKNNDKLALNYIALSYYYNNDFIMARENFRRLLSFDENNKIIKKYLKNIEIQLKGKNARKIRFDKDNLMKEEVVKKESNSKEIYNTKHENKKSKSLKIRQIIRIALFFIILINAIGRMTAHKDQADTNYNNAMKSHAAINKAIDSISIFTSVDSVEKFINTQNNINIRIYLNNVNPIKYYKITETFENRVIFSESELDQKGLRDKVESQLYIGTLKQNIFIFADSECSKRTIDKNGGYIIKGAKCGVDTNIENSIEKEYKTVYSGYAWVAGGFIDVSQAEIDKAKENSDSVKREGDKKVKIIKSAQDFKDSQFTGIYSVHLINIIPLDLYLAKYDGKNVHLYNKKEMNKDNLWNKSWVQAYSGTIDNLNIMFIDSKVSRDLIKSGEGYTVIGNKYMYVDDEVINVAAEEGQSVNAVGIYRYFIENSGLTK